MASFEEAYQNYEKSNRGQTVAGMYDKQRDAELASLKSTYEQNLSNRQAARDQIGTTYQGQANDLAAQYERNRRNLNEQVAANGMNTGTASQAALTLGAGQAKAMGGLRTAQARDVTEANRGINDLTTAYQNAVQQANAQGDYKKMAALLQDYQSERQRQLQDAQLMASYGIFDGYRDLYGDDTVNTMRNLWIAQNPLLAYNTGAIDANRYFQMTGQYAPGVAAPAAAGGGGGGRDLTWNPYQAPAANPSTETPTDPGVNASSYNLNTQKGIDNYAKALVANGDLNMRQATDLRDQLSRSSGSGTLSTKTATTSSTARGGSNVRARVSYSRT